MRRDKTLKVCANHFITPDIRMNVHCGSDKAFNWSVFADYADEKCKQELLAIKFGNPQSKNCFHKCYLIIINFLPLYFLQFYLITIYK